LLEQTPRGAIRRGDLGSNRELQDVELDTAPIWTAAAHIAEAQLRKRRLGAKHGQRCWRKAPWVFVTEHERGDFLGRAQTLLAVDALSDVTREGALSLTTLWMLDNLALQRFDVGTGNEREVAKVLTDVAVLDVQPELVEPIRRGARCIEPHGPRLGFPELRPRCGRDEREGQSIGRDTSRAAN
jgi:hypothetical protein